MKRKPCFVAQVALLALARDLTLKTHDTCRIARHAATISEAVLPANIGRAAVSFMNYFSGRRQAARWMTKKEKI